MWYNSSISDLLNWDMHDHNYDNWWQRQNDWTHAGGIRDWVEKLTKYYMSNIETDYGALSERTKAELAQERIYGVSDTALELNKVVREIQGRRDISLEAQQFRVNQEIARFWIRHAGGVIYGETYHTQYTHTLGQELVDRYNAAQQHFADMHPLEYIDLKSEDTKRVSGYYSALWGQMENQREGYGITNAWGIQDIPKIAQMPDLRHVPKAFVASHNVWQDLPTVTYVDGKATLGQQDTHSMAGLQTKFSTMYGGQNKTDH
jgi:hypothetical protein